MTPRQRVAQVYLDSALRWLDYIPFYPELTQRFEQIADERLASAARYDAMTEAEFFRECEARRQQALSVGPLIHPHFKK